MSDWEDDYDDGEDWNEADFDLEVHHVTYAHFGHEENHREDLRVLCEECHRRAHGRITTART